MAALQHRAGNFPWKQKIRPIMEQRLIYTVTELTRRIKDALESLFPHIWVEGEISNLRIPSSGHYYFTLKDSQSQLRAVMFRSQNRILPFTPEDGISIICRGRLTVYEPRGDYQLLVETMEPKGKGALQLAFEQLRKKLQAEGLFADGRKRPIPVVPGRLAIITSPTGAAVRDILKVLNRRFANLEILIVPVKVQGDGAAEEISQALYLVNQQHAADVIIIARGGGSLEDLWAFNTEVVARAIGASEIPVISAVGHEIDFTIADFVADLRAPTPSAAAELVVRDKRELLQILSHTRERLNHALQSCLVENNNRIAALSQRLGDPTKRIIQYHLRCDDLRFRLVNTLPRHLRQRKSDLDHYREVLFLHAPRSALHHYRTSLGYLKKGLIAAIERLCQKNRSGLRSGFEKLTALNPVNILQRGYSITRLLPTEELVTSSRQIHRGDTVDVRLSEGEAYCIVDKVIL